MSVQICRHPEDFEQILGGKRNLSYVILGGSRIAPVLLRSLLAGAKRSGHDTIEHDQQVASEALQQIRSFFNQCETIDTDWFFSFSSKVPLSIPGYQDVQKIFLILAYLKLYPERELLVLAADAKIRSLAQHALANTPCHQRTLPGLKGGLRMGRSLIRILLAGRYHGDSVDSLLFTLAARPPRDGRDAYFGMLSEVISEKNSVATVYFCAGSSVRFPVLSGMYPVEMFASIRDILAAFITSIRSARRSRRDYCHFTSAGHGAIYSFLRNREILYGETIYTGFLTRVFKKLLWQLSPQRTIYPFENRSWEKHLVAAIRQSETGYSIGYQHSSITPRHLAFHIDNGQQAEAWLPDQVVTIGEVTRSWLRRTAPVLADRLTVGVSMRRVNCRKIPPAQTDAVLVAISSSREEAWSLMNIVYEASSLTNVPFYIRTHPTIPVADIFYSFDWLEHVHLSSGKTLIEDIERSSMVAYSSSTVALEGMLFGRVPIFVDIGDIPSGDPIVGNYSFKYCAENSEALADSIESVRRMSGSKLADMQAEAAMLAEECMRFPDRERLDRLLIDIGVS